MNPNERKGRYDSTNEICIYYNERHALNEWADEHGKERGGETRSKEEYAANHIANFHETINVC